MRRSYGGAFRRPFFHGTERRLASLIGTDNIVYSPRPSVPCPHLSLGKYLMGKLEEHGNQEALMDIPTGRRMSFTQLRDAVIRVTSALSKLGIKKGDVVLVCSTNCLEFPVLCVAVLNLGAVFSPVNPASTVDDLQRQLELSQASCVVGGNGLTVNIDRASQGNTAMKIVFGCAEGWIPFSVLMEDDGRSYSHPEPVDPFQHMAFLSYSSGTTGLPKGVMLTHHNVLVNMMQFSQSFPTQAGEDKVLAYLPFYHAYGLIVKILNCLNGGLSMSIVPRFDESFLQTMSQERITILHLVPPVCVFMLKHPDIRQYDLSAIRAALCGAAPIGGDQVAEFRERFGIEDFIQGYGLTETSPLATIDCRPVRVGSVGQAMSSVTLKVVDLETGESLGPGQSGEICIKGPNVMAGYYRNPEATANAIKGDWLHSGDIGHFDEDGYFFVTDRVKELIKYKAQQVAPAELEGLLLTHPWVRDAAVIGVPDPEAGELPRAYVVLKPGVPSDVTAEAIKKFVDEKVTSFKRLRGGVGFLESIPKSPSGKILRRTLKSQL
ncbi:uncharacterized protein LOC135468982 isoform X2 [Liolophura sinensis]|uniref:uncharacterized protein LOC135468982 isoform X2 n=1 Tax=Liolophura sinensis TaxID=3198878 RepID=UPI00315964AE